MQSSLGTLAGAGQKSCFLGQCRRPEAWVRLRFPSWLGPAGTTVTSIWFGYPSRISPPKIHHLGHPRRQSAVATTWKQICFGVSVRSPLRCPALAKRRLERGARTTERPQRRSPSGVTGCLKVQPDRSRKAEPVRFSRVGPEYLCEGKTPPQ